MQRSIYFIPFDRIGSCRNEWFKKLPRRGLKKVGRQGSWPAAGPANIQGGTSKLPRIFFQNFIRDFLAHICFFFKKMDTGFPESRRLLDNFFLNVECMSSHCRWIIMMIPAVFSGAYGSRETIDSVCMFFFRGALRPPADPFLCTSIGIPAGRVNLSHRIPNRNPMDSFSRCSCSVGRHDQCWWLWLRYGQSISSEKTLSWCY